MAAVALLLLVGVLVEHNRRLNVAHQHQQALLEDKLERGLQASALAHELRQPLSHLLMQSRLMQYRVESGVANPEAVLEGVHNLQRSAQQINQLIDTITALLRGQTSQTEPVDLVLLVQELLASCCAERSLRQIQLHLNLPTKPMVLELNKAQISIAIRNLLMNAQQALIDVEAQHRHLAVTLDQKTDQILLQVADSGPGLPSHSLRELMMNSSTANGMGLGLFTVHAIAKHHQGRLMLGQSRALRGAECSLWLPTCGVDPGTSIDTALPGAPVGIR